MELPSALRRVGDVVGEHRRLAFASIVSLTLGAVGMKVITTDWYKKVSGTPDTIGKAINVGGWTGLDDESFMPTSDIFPTPDHIERVLTQPNHLKG